MGGEEENLEEKSTASGGAVSPDSGAFGQTVITDKGKVPSPSDLSKKSPNLLIGSMLGNHEIQEMIGGGGMGTVYKAFDQQLNRTVAIKVLTLDQQVPGNIDRFLNEAQSAAQLDHEHIARVYQIDQDQGWNFIVFEYIEGENLRDIIHEKEPLSIDRVITYAAQIASALEHAWERGIVHRDIKPSNVIITPEEKAKVVDMGLARLQTLEDRHELTATGVTLGTFDYISPEQAKDPRNADIRSDIYSLGCTIYYMLTGHPPFPEGTVLQKLLSHSSESPVDPRQYRKEIPEVFVDFVAKMLSKDPKNRFQNPKILRQQISILAHELEIPLHENLTTAIPYFSKELRNRIVSWSLFVGGFVGVAILIDRLLSSWAR